MTDVTKLEELAGHELGTVSLVRDYVELIFDGPILRSLAPPSVLVHESQATFGDPGSRDLLCELIGLAVVSANDLEDSIRVDFDGGAVFQIPKASLDVGAEVAHFVPEFHGRKDVSEMVIWENSIPTRVDDDSRDDPRSSSDE